MGVIERVSRKDSSPAGRALLLQILLYPLRGEVFRNVKVCVAQPGVGLILTKNNSDGDRQLQVNDTASGESHLARFTHPPFHSLIIEDSTIYKDSVYHSRMTVITT
jgi:hypothetical protein